MTTASRASGADWTSQASSMPVALRLTLACVQRSQIHHHWRARRGQARCPSPEVLDLARSEYARAIVDMLPNVRCADRRRRRRRRSQAEPLPAMPESTRLTARTVEYRLLRGSVGGSCAVITIQPSARTRRGARCPWTTRRGNTILSRAPRARSWPGFRPGGHIQPPQFSRCQMCRPPSPHSP
jgi:hypothetical protein